MKKPWTEIAKRILKLSNTPGERDFQFRKMFLNHHRHACEIITNQSGEPLAAVYFTPIGMHQEQTKTLFREIQNRVQYTCDTREQSCICECLVK